jgi:hypothetical protein
LLAPYPETPRVRFPSPARFLPRFVTFQGFAGRKISAPVCEEFARPVRASAARRSAQLISCANSRPKRAQGSKYDIIATMRDLTRRSAIQNANISYDFQKQKSEKTQSRHSVRASPSVRIFPPTVCRWAPARPTRRGGQTIRLLRISAIAPVRGGRRAIQAHRAPRDILRPIPERRRSARGRGRSRTIRCR